MRFFMLRETTTIEKFYNLPYLIIILLILSVEKIILCHFVYFISCSLQRDMFITFILESFAFIYVFIQSFTNILL